jgi:hypothetical protein
MTNKIIDVNLLLEKMYSIAIPKEIGAINKIVSVNELRQIINELTTTQQESIFDVDGWLDIKTAPQCKMLIVYDCENKVSAVATYRPSYSNDPNKNWRDAWDYSKWIKFIPTHYRFPLPKLPTRGR